ncbi:unnamed protein product [Porites evermanni]|uniref:Uncharacterized protein n=1 Tax=Porites evermanni TaxID=104178 RepID=A0ABN8PHK7_9CNID|nr:unnamed protein product [Porites evermanni]
MHEIDLESLFRDFFFIAKGMEKVALWSDHIVRHFWHCCSLASEVEGNELEALKILKGCQHTGALERANSLSLMYASKRISYTEKVYKARKQLAAIDWNYHLDIPEQEDVLGEVAVTRKYNQRTKSWNVKIVKQAKDYGYIWMLLAKVFRLRVEDNENMQRAVPMEADDPRRIAPSIAVVPPPPSRELFIQPSSRFKKN